MQEISSLLGAFQQRPEESPKPDKSHFLRASDVQQVAELETASFYAKTPGGSCKTSLSKNESLAGCLESRQDLLAVQVQALDVKRFVTEHKAFQVTRGLRRARSNLQVCEPSTWHPCLRRFALGQRILAVGDWPSGST